LLLLQGRAAGIDMSAVLRLDDAQTSTYVSMLDESGDMQVAINDMSIIDRLSATQLEPQKAMLGRSALMIVDCNLSQDVLEWLTATFSSTPIFADTVSAAKASRIKPYLQSVHTLKASAIEIAALAGKEARTQTQLQTIAGDLHSQGLKRLFVTRGEQGVFYSTPDEQGLEKPISENRNVSSTGGAGDAFLAGLAYSWLENSSLADSLRFALAAADITLSHPATNNPALSVKTVKSAMQHTRAR